MIRVLLLDDHEVVRRGICELHTQDGDVEIVGESGSAVEASHRLPALRPDVAILDARLSGCPAARLPDGNGIDVCRDVRAVDPTIQALILTSYDDDAACSRRSWPGPPATSSSRSAATTSLDAVRRVAAGQSLLDPAVTARVMARIRDGAAAPDELKSLTDQERRILRYVAQGLTNREIAQEMFLADKTVKNYVSSVLSKLGLGRRTEAAVLATNLSHDSTG